MIYSTPVMRPLWFHYPDDPRTYLIEDQYLVGHELLVAPVVTEAVTKRRVYFPAGDNWVDWWTGKFYEGGKDAEIDAPLARLPLFARVGAVIPTQVVVQHTGEMSRLPLVFTVVSGDGSPGVILIDDDSGDGLDYKNPSAYDEIGASPSSGGTHFEFSRPDSHRSTRPPREVALLALARRGSVPRPRPRPEGARVHDAQGSFVREAHGQAELVRRSDGTRTLPN